ncbi:efflux RND transporter permease subunit [Pinisolibacter aquiterrae]|uniref:efflux RND transporter permease subunit n=1 Tax=Pinisolibacter aquiterrae TaxID=2815579 RepID=UPI001C3DA6BB|nr:efflux RND transporter permease subunit [Pinisolibacter aquiterrae]MBV5263139.1 efflux RND transporter permease subunit [Pinisolibacter aquiterrae]MCC8234053.1 efflux RND transporter permease subunit [Pinisolibacter aquiterrae]
MLRSMMPGQGFNLSRWAIRHGHLTRFFFALVVIAGFFSVTSLGQKEDPDFTFRVMIVQAVWPGSSLEEMQDQVVDKIEKKLQETPGLENIKSYTRAGSAVVMVSIRGDVFGRDVTDAFYQVRKKIADISGTLPAGVLGPYFNDEFGDTYIALYAFTGEGYSYPELKHFAKEARDAVLRIPGIEKAQILGDQDEKIFIDVASKTLAERGISVQSIAEALAQQNSMTPAGRVETGIRSVRIAVDGNLKTLDDLRELRIRAGSEVIRLGDIAQISSGLIDPPDRRFRFDGHDAVLLGMVMSKGGNVTKIGTELTATMTRIQSELPLGAEIGRISDQPEVVAHSIDEFFEALLEALAIVLAVSFLSIGWRAGLVVAITIPTVLAATFSVMEVMGIDLQRISLGALIIALGLLVDDAMIAVEMMERKLDEGLDKISAASFAYTSTAFPMLTGTLVTTAGFIPVGFAKSTAGEYVNSLFWVVGIALVTSWIAAVYFTPWIGNMILKARPHTGEHRDAFDGRFYRSLRATIAWGVRHRLIVLVLTLCAFVVGVMGFKYVPKSFFPESTRLELLVDLWFPEGTGIAETDAKTREIEKKIMADADQDYVASFVGEGAPRFYLPLDQQLRNPNFSEVLVVAKDLAARERLVDKIRAMIGTEYPSIRFKVDKLFNGPPVGWAVQMRVTGPDRKEVRRIADRVADAFRADPLLSTVHDDWLEPVPALRLVVDQDRARALGVTSQTIRQTLQGALSGLPIGEFRPSDETVSIVVRQGESRRDLLTAVEETYVTTASGRSVPMSQVAQVVPVMEPGIEWRRNRLPSITVRGIIPDGTPSNDVTQRIYDGLKPLRESLAPGYTIEMQGAVEESAKSQDSINAKAPIMILVMMVLLMIQLQHFGKTMLVFMTAPLGLIGASAALLLTNSAFGFVAILGVIALAGIIMRNAVILIDQIDQDMASGHHPWHATIEAAVRRFRPIMLTAAAAVLALIPIAQSAFWGPMAYAMMGGILAATVLTIIVLPAAFALFFRVREPEEPDLDHRVADGGSVEMDIEDPTGRHTEPTPAG